MKKIISSVLALATILGCIAILPFGTFARENGETIITIPVPNPTEVTNEILQQNYASAQEKIDNDANMKCYVTVGDKQLYANPYTGEIYVKDTQTGQILNSNPYSLDGVPDATKEEIMSQLVVNYSETTATTVSGRYIYSFTDAAKRGQITMTATANGIRADYIIGDTTKRYAMPYGIMANDFIEIVMVPLQRQTWQLMYDMAVENGLPQEILDQSFDFEAYCERYISLYGTMDKYGKEYTFGNIDAFDAWINDATYAYSQYYRTHPTIERTERLAALTDDFLAINQAYIEHTAYMRRTRMPYRESWTLNPEALEDFPVLTLKTEVAEDGTVYYTDSVFTLDTTLTSRQLRMYESLFKAYAPNYTMDDITAAEDYTNIHPEAVVNPIFYISLEYTLTSQGLSVSMPATSISYDESLYIVNSIGVLPYFGTGKVTAGGYVFYPDGSGTIIDFDDFATTYSTLQGKVYGQDYAYYTIAGQHQQSINMPVYGAVKTENTYYFNDPYNTGEKIQCNVDQYNAKTYTITYVRENGQFWAVYPYGRSATPVTTYFDGTEFRRLLNDSNQTSDPAYYTNARTVVSGDENFSCGTASTNGFLAIMDDGASLGTIRVSLTPGSQNPYSSVYATYVPRAKDSYDLADTMNEISNSATFTVLAKNRYLGSYTTHFVMLADEELATAAGKTSYYPASYVGMAAAYQQYLIDEGVLTSLQNLQEQLPLYIESFGVVQTTKKVLSIPFTVDVALTTFNDIETMYKELADKNITNIKFRLTGFTNGGMYSTYPTKLKWESKAGGKRGYKDLLTFASETGNGLEIFPNFNFSYVEALGRFDGINLKNVGARSVDNRYAMSKSYSSVYQEYISAGGAIVSANYFEELFAKFNRKNSKLGNQAISLDYLASDLATDFNEENLLSREDSLAYTLQFLKTVRESGYSSLMLSGGNSYAFQYADYLLNAPIDSSHYRVTSTTIPFWGMVVHSFVNYAGAPFNEQGNKPEALLRAIESGASLYFMLSYDNTRLLKDDALLSEYYSVNYQISKTTVESYYKALNDVIGDLQGYKIVNHQSVSVERMQTAEEIAAMVQTLQDEFIEQLAVATLASMERQRDLIRDIISIKHQITSETPNQTLLSSVGDLIKEYGTEARIVEIVGENASSVDMATRTTLFNAIRDGTLSSDYGQIIMPTYDRDAVFASAQVATFTDVLDEAFKARIEAYMDGQEADENATVDVLANVSTVAYDSAYDYFTVSKALDKDYIRTDYTVDNGSVVMVTYSNGEKSVDIFLNFNIFSVTVEMEGYKTISLERYGYSSSNENSEFHWEKED